MNYKKWIASLLSICLLGGVFAGTAAPTLQTEAASSRFAFNGSMSKETLRAYCSRAVTLAGFCVENNAPDPVFEDSLRMLCRIGAKYIGRAAYYSWGGNMSWEQIQNHYKVAKERAELAHKADPEMILQGGVFEIIYQGTVNSTPVPEYVFEAFQLPVEKRNFRYLDMVYDTPGHRFYYKKEGGYWGMGAESAVPNIAKLETQMYFYWQITQYIDAGYEAIHLGQAELMADNNRSNFVHWDKVTSMARAYAEVKARRGIILFDCHDALDSPGMKVGNRLICDIQGAGIVPNETVYENGAYKCEIADYHDVNLQWIGRSGGGEHPLGFTIEENFTILEFDNHGGNGRPGVATYDGFYCWGWDDITWFALQPAWYRNQFLLECHDYLTHNNLDSDGEQQYFLQPSCRRVLVDTPVFTFKVDDVNNLDHVLDYLAEERTDFVIAEDGSFTLTVKKDYRANNQSDACPNGFGQEDTIREIFLGKNYPEDPAYTGCVVPGTTAATKATTKPTTKATTQKTTADTTKPVINTTAALTTGVVETTLTSADTTTTGTTTTSTGTDETVTTTAPSVPTDTDPGADNKGVPTWVWIAIAAVAVLSVAVVVVFLLLKKGKAV